MAFSGGNRIFARGSGRKGDDRLIRRGDARDITAAIGFVGQLVVPAGILDLKHLTGSLGNCGALGQFQNRIVEVLDRRGHIAVQNAVNVLLRVWDLSVAISREIFELIDEIILCGIRHVLYAYGGFKLRVKVCLIHLNRRRRGIVDRGAGDLVGTRLRGGGSSNGVGKIVLFHLQEVRVEDNLSAVVVQIVVFDRDVVDRDLTEDSHGNDIAVDDRIRGHFLTGSLIDPLLKDLAGNEGGLRQGADGLSRCPEVLEQPFGRAAFLLNDEADIVRVVEHGRDRHVAGHLCCAGDVVAVFIDPLDKFFALYHGIGGQGADGMPLVNGHRIMDRLFIDHKGDGDDRLVVSLPDARVRGDLDTVGKFTAAVCPVSKVAVLDGDGRDVVQAVAGSRIDRLGCDHRLLVFPVESDSVGERIIVRTDGHIFADRVGVAFLTDPSALVRLEARILAVGSRASGPVGNIILTLDNRGHADNSAIIYSLFRDRIAVTVNKDDRADRDVNCGQGHVVLHGNGRHRLTVQAPFAAVTGLGRHRGQFQHGAVIIGAAQTFQNGFAVHKGHGVALQAAAFKLRRVGGFTGDFRDFRIPTGEGV